MADLPTEELAIPAGDPEALPKELAVPAAPPPIMSPATATARAEKLSFAVPSQPFESTYAQLIAGEEPDLRKSIAAKVDYEETMRKQTMIKNVAEGYAKTGKPIPNSLFEELNKPTSTDPTIAFEKVYGKAYLDKLRETRGDPQSVLSSADKIDPNISEGLIKKAEGLTTYTEWLRNKRDDIHDVLKQQGWGGYLIDQGKMISQVYQEIKIRGLADTPFFLELGLGSTLDAQAVRLFQKSFPDFSKTIDTIVTKLAKDNPSLALFYIDSLIGQSSNEAFLNNFMSVATLTGVGTATRLARGAVRGGKEIIQAEKAAKDFVKASTSITEPANIRIAEGLGDLNKAAEAHIANEVLDMVAKKEDPVKKAVDSMSPLFKADETLFNAQQGTKFSTEIVNRIGERMNLWGTKVLETIANTMNVERLPFMKVTENYAADVIKGYEAELRSGRLEDAYIKSQVRWDPVTRTYHVDHIIGKPDGTFWKGVDGAVQAEVFAGEHGLKYLKETPTTIRTGDLTLVGGSKGSSYTVTATGTTQRTLSPTELAQQAKRSEGKGVIGTTALRAIPDRPESAKTVYLDKETAQRIERRYDKKGNLPEGVRIVDNGKELVVVAKGTETQFANRSKGLAGTEQALERIPYHTDPAVGKRPLELFNADHPFHLGKEISEVTPGYKLESKTDFSIEQYGGSHYIRISHPLDETKDFVRDALLKTDITHTPKSLGDTYLSFLSKWRTPEETLSQAQRDNRHAATYAPSALLKLFKEEAKDIARLARWTIPGTAKRERWDDWQKVVNFARDAIDPVSKEKGYFFKSMGELEEHYQQFIKRGITEAEAKAYFSFVKLSEADRILRNLELYKMKSRVGAQEFTFSLMDRDGKQLISPSFEGILRKQWPSTSDVVVVAPEGRAGMESVQRGGTIVNQKNYEASIQAVKEGRMHVIEVYDVEARALQGFGKIGNERVRYVVVPAYENKPLSWNQVTAKGGSFFDTQYEHYIKQAKIMPETFTSKVGNEIVEHTRHWYEGDTTFMGVMLRKMGGDVSENLNILQKLIREEKIGEAQAFAKQRFPIEWDKLYSYFKETKDANGKIMPSRFSLHEPFYVVPRGKLVTDVDRSLQDRYTAPSKTGRTVSTFHDGTREGSLARQHQVEYTGKRDDYEVFSFKDVGSRSNPVYNYEPAKYLDPVPALNRGLNKIVNSAYLNDYKIFSVEHWLREALGNGDPKKAVIDISDVDARRSPFWAFRQAMEKFKAGGDEATINRLKTAHYQIDQLMGVKDKTDLAVGNIVQKLADSVYGRYGPGRLTDVSLWALPKTKDPLDFVRGMVFHAKLGLWNIPQLVVQMQTFANIMGVAGIKYAGPGTKASLLHRWAGVNGQHIDYLDQLASKQILPGTYRIQAGGFKEAYETLLKTGFDNVAGEHMMRDAVMTHRVVQSGAGALLDSGSWFFREGERQTRLGAWYTAFFEFRAANPTGRLTEQNVKDILTRADLLSVNMSRASASKLHTGVLALPTQFLAYQMRTAELFMGKRLTQQERYRLILTNSALYGVPGSFGLTGLPIADVWRKNAQDQGYVVGENYLHSVFAEGIPALTIAMITGNWYNIQDRYGIQGMDSIREAMRGDKTVWDIVMGASGSMFRDAFRSVDPFWRVMRSVFNSEGNFKLHADDYLKPLKLASSASAGIRAWDAINTGRWMGKDGQFLDEVSPHNAVFQSLFGLQSAKSSGAFLGGETLKDREDKKKETEKLFSEQMRRGLMALRDRDHEQATEYFKNGMVILRQRGFPENEMTEAFAAAMDNNRPLHAKIDWDLAYKNIPNEEIKTQAKYYQNKLRTKQGL